MLKFLTSFQKKFWAERKINWEQDYMLAVDPVSGKPMWNHPHRALIIAALRTFHWISLWEVGCGAGANLVKIAVDFKINPEHQLQIGGSDVNPDAIEAARKFLVGGKFHVESTEDMLLSDDATDVVLSDATLIYIDPFKIKKVIKELVRVSRNRIVLCEFHSTNWLDRWMLRLKTGYNAYNYVKLLEEEGCYDIQVVKMPKELWDGFPWQPWGAVLIANVPK